MNESLDFRPCMFEPTAEVLESGLLIEEAGLSLLKGERARAAALLREADMPELLQHLNTATGKATWPRSRPPIPKEQRWVCPDPQRSRQRSRSTMCAKEPDV
jgi:hypothetical protein